MASNLLDLYAYAERRHIDVDWVPMRRAMSLSVPLADGYAIALDPWKLGTLAQETVCLAHELGHCETGSFYNRYAARDIRQKYENRANKWAYKKLVPQDELAEACLQGYREPWELAEYFGVTEDFLRGALKYYQEKDYIVT